MKYNVILNSYYSSNGGDQESAKLSTAVITYSLKWKSCYLNLTFFQIYSFFVRSLENGKQYFSINFSCKLVFPLCTFQVSVLHSLMHIKAFICRILLHSSSFYFTMYITLSFFRELVYSIGLARGCFCWCFLKSMMITRDRIPLHLYICSIKILCILWNFKHSEW